jgi:hypothetical protein
MRPIEVIIYFVPEQLPSSQKPGIKSRPEKLKHFLEKISKSLFAISFQVISDLQPLNKEDFLLAHESCHVNASLNGENPFCELNIFSW